MTLTHIRFVLKVEVASGSEAVEVRGPLLVVVAGESAAVLRRAEPLEPFAHDGRVLPVIVGVHLNVGRADVAFVASGLR